MGKKSKGKGKGKKKQRRDALLASSPVMPTAGTPTAARPEPDGSGRAVAELREAVGATELAARLASLGTILQRYLAGTDAGDGLTRARLSALGLLVLGGPRTLGELAAAERVRPPTMTRLVDAMVADGLVAREKNPDDARSVIVRATPRGEAQLEQGRARQVAPLATAIAGLDPAERLGLEDSVEVLGRLLREAERGVVEAPG